MREPLRNIKDSKIILDVKNTLLPDTMLGNARKRPAGGPRNSPELNVSRLPIQWIVSAYLPWVLAEQGKQ